LDVCQQTPGVFVACTPNPADASDTAPCTNAIQSDDGPCTNSVCHLSGKACTTDTDCQTTQANLGKCLQFGSCAGDPTLSCGISNPGHDQPGCGANNTAGMCVAATSSFCVHETLCDPDAYATPAVDFLTLPDTAGTLNASIGAQMPAGDTPTRQALLGAVAHARAHAAANVGHSVVIVLATDGLPTDCTGGREVSGESDTALNDVVGVVTEGFTPKAATDASIQTFVVGVFADSEAMSAQTNLDKIAAAGGTDHAFVVSSGGDVQQAFLTALNDIRAARLSCEFQLPKPTSGSTLDIHQVNVELQTATMMTSELYYVTPTGCTGASDEWHYDQEPNPTKLVACPNTCDALKMAQNAQVSVKLGCMAHIR
ncbi:MAG TPA: VWA domain-containing protein, partial [Polyangiaceae bacterium]|nr:VWA domain-containing protein [Polyangiaceae bacterium]